jgi:4-amino-4-deoxy-L-arabinose transferase-like glycosyltransferase
MAGLLLAALLVRLLYFTGLALGDDVFYSTQAQAWAQSGNWPPQPLHWHTRLGMVAPVALCIKLFGPCPIAFVLWPLLASVTGVLVCFAVATDLVGRRTAWVAAVFQAAFPLELIYSTHLFPDVVVGVFSVLSLWYWIRGLRNDRATDYFLAGAFFASGYLCRETVLMEGPIYLVLWAWAGRLRRPRLAWVFVVPVVALALECGLYAATTGTPMYRWKAIAAQQQEAGNLELIRTGTSGGNFWTDPLLMLVARQEFALYQAFALAAAAYGLWRWPAVRPLALWLAVGFVWLYYGTTVPTRWVNLQRDPRYAVSLTTPAVILLAFALGSWPARLRWPVVGLLVGTGLFAAGLDQGQTIRTPHRLFVNSEYAAEAVLEPFEYAGALWEAGPSPPAFGCAEDLGRPSVFRLFGELPGASVRRTSGSRYVVLSPERRPELLARLKGEGWEVVSSLSGEPTPSRALVALLLARLPSQQQRANRILHPPRLFVLRNPLMACKLP